jgi:hypothetical protein
VHQQSTRNAESTTTGNNDQQPAAPVQIKFPMELDFDEIVGVSVCLFRDTAVSTH